tara:strand:+ start:2872 stop:3369 length:498 start_codon:yes stop_codon:yes gene_type:complete
MVKDITMFFLVTVISLALASFVGGINDHVANLDTGSQTALLVSPVSSNPTDADLFQECFERGIQHDGCENADFNGNGIIDSTDAGLLAANSKFDVNQDGVIVLHFPAKTISDYETLVACWLSEDTSSNCRALDFDGDGIVNNDDGELMQAALQFDLNDNKRIEWR